MAKPKHVFPKTKTYIKRDVWRQRTWEPLDPSSPYIEDGKIYRDIFAKQEGLHRAVCEGLTQDWAQQGFLPNHTFHESEGRIEVERIPWCCFVNDYCKLQSRDALMHSLRFVAELNKHKLSLQDLHAGQFCFHYYNPIYYDFGSIGNNNGMVIPGARKWAQRFDCVLESERVRPMIEELRQFRPKEKADFWDSYHQNLNIPREDNPEIAFIKEWLDRRPPKSVLDAGANKGRIAKYVANQGIPVLACDTAAKCIEHLYKFSWERKLPITSMHWDMMKPPHLVGYEEIKCDMLIGSSLSHHLYKAGYNFVEQEKVIRQLARDTVLYEYVDSKDKHVKSWGVNWTRDEFEHAFKDYEILATLSPELPSRTWYVLGV